MLALCVGLALSAGRARAQDADYQYEDYGPYDDPAYESDGESDGEGDERSLYARNGFYAGLSGHYALELFDTDPITRVPGFSASSRDTGGFGVSIGYRAHRHFAAEGLFQQYARFRVRSKQNGQRLESDKFAGYSWTLNGKAYLLTGRIQPYGLLGMGVLVLKKRFRNDRQESFAGRMGGGIDFYLTENWLLGGEIGYMAPARDLDDFPFVTFAGIVSYRF